MPQLSILDLYDEGVRATDELLDRLAGADPAVCQRRPVPRVWSAEEYARHLVWLEDAVLRVECLGLEPAEMPEHYAVLPGQVREHHFGVLQTRDMLAALRHEIRPALAALSPDALTETIEDSGGRTVAGNISRYLELTAAARACARLVLRLAMS